MSSYICASCGLRYVECECYKRKTTYVEMLERQLGEERAEVSRLKALLNTPLTEDFLAAVKIEVPHQVERWGSDHDDGKSDADWFWLIGFLVGKIMHAPNDEKKLHHCISAAAALCNWHTAIKNKSSKMRPGILVPKGEQ